MGLQEIEHLQLLIGNIKTILEPICSNKGLFFRIRYNWSAADINVDFMDLQTISLNILNTAMVNTSDGGILFDIIEKDNQWDFDITNSYSAVEESDLSFMRDTKGLCLNIAKELIQKYDGNLTLQSEIGKTGIFKFTIPK